MPVLFCQIFWSLYAIGIAYDQERFTISKTCTVLLLLAKIYSLQLLSYVTVTMLLIYFYYLLLFVCMCIVCKYVVHMHSFDVNMFEIIKI